MPAQWDMKSERHAARMTPLCCWVGRLAGAAAGGGGDAGADGAATVAGAAGAAAAGGDHL